MSLFEVPVLPEPAHELQDQLRNVLVLWRMLADHVLAYDAAIQACANDPERMASFCTANGDDLDMLYHRMVEAAGLTQPSRGT